VSHSDRLMIRAGATVGVPGTPYPTPQRVSLVCLIAPDGNVRPYPSPSKENDVAARDVTTPRARGRTTGRPGFIQRLGTETKAAFKTTEFYVMIAVLVGILIAGNAVEIAEGGTDYFAADKVWLYITILASSYMISRGLAKSGSRDPYWSDSGQNRERDDANGVGPRA
jgi:hypothetical protein